MNFSVMWRFSGLHPARGSGLWLELRDQFCECVAHLIRQVERDEEAHGYVRLRGKRK